MEQRFTLARQPVRPGAVQCHPVQGARNRRKHQQVEAQLDCRPAAEIGVNEKIGVTWSRERSFKMAATKLGYLLSKWSFWLSLWHDTMWHIIILAWRQRIISLVCFASSNVIHSWPGWCRYLTEKCLPDSHLPFVYVVILSISPTWKIEETNPSGKNF